MTWPSPDILIQIPLAPKIPDWVSVDESAESGVVVAVSIVHQAAFAVEALAGVEDFPGVAAIAVEAVAFDREIGVADAYLAVGVVDEAFDNIAVGPPR